MKRYLAVLLLALFALAAPASAQTFPENKGSPVVDQAGILRPEQVYDLKSKSEALYAETGRAFAVATVKSLEGRDPDDYAYQLLRHWKLGSAENDDGVLLVVAPNDRKVAISTGYGAGEYMTDAMSGTIIREKILPQFRKNPPDYGAGITAGADAIIQQMQLQPDQARATAEQARQRESRRGASGFWFMPVLFVMIVTFAILASIARRGSGRRYRARRSGIDPWIVLWGLNELSRSRGRGGWGGGGWGGGGFGGFGGGGGGFGGFVGGSGGGGGASGSW